MLNATTTSILWPASACRAASRARLSTMIAREIASRMLASGYNTKLPRRIRSNRLEVAAVRLGTRLRIFLDRQSARAPAAAPPPPSGTGRTKPAAPGNARATHAASLDGVLEIDRIARRRRENLVRDQPHAFGLAIKGHGNQRGAVALGRGIDANPDGKRPVLASPAPAKAARKHPTRRDRRTCSRATRTRSRSCAR